MQVRRNSPVLSYGGDGRSTTSSNHNNLSLYHPRRRRRSRPSTIGATDKWTFIYRSLFFGTFMVATCLHISLSSTFDLVHSNTATPMHEALFRLHQRRYLRGNYRHKIGDCHHELEKGSTKFRLSYIPPLPGAYPRTKWTMKDFVVQGGVNLAEYGYTSDDFDDEAVDQSDKNVDVQQQEEEQWDLTGSQERVTSSLVFEPFELYDDFDISVYIRALDQSSGHDNPNTFSSSFQERNDNNNNKDALEESSSATHLLLYHRHLEHPTLAFYIDKIAQKRYLQAKSIPVPKSFALKYYDELVVNPDGAGAGDDMEPAIDALLPHNSNYVIKASHKRNVSMAVSHSSSNNNPHHDIAHQLNLELHDQDTNQFLEPWSSHYVTPGIIVEDRIMALDKIPDHSPLQLQAYVVWGRVWLVTWSSSVEDNKMTGTNVMYRNGTIFYVNHDSHERSMVTNVPDWSSPWNRVVQLAEELGANKDFYQVNMLVGIPATSTSTSVVNITTSQQPEKPEVVISSCQYDPLVELPDPELFHELGRLWMAGYQMGIYRTIPNREVPQEFIQLQRLTEEDAKRLKQRSDRGPFWNLQRILFGDFSVLSD